VVSSSFGRHFDTEVDVESRAAAPVQVLDALVAKSVDGPVGASRRHVQRECLASVGTLIVAPNAWVRRCAPRGAGRRRDVEATIGCTRGARRSTVRSPAQSGGAASLRRIVVRLRRPPATWMSGSSTRCDDRRRDSPGTASRFVIPCVERVQGIEVTIWRERIAHSLHDARPAHSRTSSVRFRRAADPSHVLQRCASVTFTSWSREGGVIA